MTKVSKSIKEVPPTHASVSQILTREPDSFIELVKVSLLVGIFLNIYGCLIKVLHVFFFLDLNLLFTFDMFQLLILDLGVLRMIFRLFVTVMMIFVDFEF